MGPGKVLGLRWSEEGDRLDSAEMRHDLTSLGPISARFYISHLQTWLGGREGVGMIFP